MSLANKPEIFSKISTQTYNHWVFQRLTAVFLGLAGFYLFFVSVTKTLPVIFDVYNWTTFFMLWDLVTTQNSCFIQIGSFLFFVISFIHITEGVQTIIQDYVHSTSTRTFLSIILKCIQIESLKYICLLLL